MGKVIDNQDCKTCVYRSVFFKQLNPDELLVINKHKREVFFEKGEDIVCEGDEIKDFLYLKSGLIKLVRQAPNNRQQIISIAEPNDFIGLLGIFAVKNYEFTITCIEESVACFVTLHLIRDIILQNGEFSLGFIEKMSRVSGDIWKSKFELARRNLRGRIAKIILHFAENIYKSMEFDLPVSRKEVAELIDMTTENVIRILSEFRSDGILAIKGKRIKIIDPLRLKRISDLG